MDVLTLNTHSGGHARYDDFPFSSVVRSPAGYLACGADGIYLLDQGDAVKVHARIVTAVVGNDTPNVKTCAYAALDCQTQGTLSLEVTTDGDKMIPYDVTARAKKEGFHTKHRELPPRGRRGNNWQFAIINDGMDFTINQMRVQMFNSKRSK